MSLNLHIPIGIPGCGKSTFAERMGFEPVKLTTVAPGSSMTLAKFYPVAITRRVIISSDQIRSEMGDINDQSQNTSVFDIFHGLINWELGRVERDVYADATNLDWRSRDSLREIAERYGVRTHVVLFNNPLEAIERNRKRDRQVPEDVMMRMISKLERARADIIQESYDSVTTIASVR